MSDRKLQRAFEGYAGEYQHHDHEDQQERYVAAYGGEVRAFEQDLFYRAYRMGLGIDVREGPQPRRKALHRINRAAREKQDHIQKPRERPDQSRMAGASEHRERHRQQTGRADDDYSNQHRQRRDSAQDSPTRDHQAQEQDQNAADAGYRYAAGEDAAGDVPS